LLKIGFLCWVLARGERTVKKLRLSKALTIPEGTTVYDASRRMAARRVDAVLLTDAQGLLSGIVTDKVNPSTFLSYMVEFCGWDMLS
jgi:signal-transduction protein with cAMP-binding, CBS, and nucleotidyltransferase domain